jgi:hypothetical protein
VLASVVDVRALATSAMEKNRTERAGHRRRLSSAERAASEDEAEQAHEPALETPELGEVDIVDLMSLQSFPASDAPAFWSR